MGFKNKFLMSLVAICLVLVMLSGVALAQPINDDSTDSAVLSIHYIRTEVSDIGNIEIEITMAAPFTGEFEVGQPYSHTSPVISGYTANSTVVSGSSMPADGLEVIVEYSPNEASYTVNHFQKNLDGTFSETPYDTETLQSVTGAETEAAAKQIEGFTPEFFVQEVIEYDNSTTVNIYYERNVSYVYFVTDGGNYVPVLQKQFGEIVTAGELSAATKAGYDFSGWYMNSECTNAVSTFTMGDSNVQLYAKWSSPKTTTYTVSYLVESLTNPGGYDVFWSGEYEATTDSTVTYNSAVHIPPFSDQDKLGFKLNTSKNSEIVVEGDGTSVLEIYYERNTFTLEFWRFRNDAYFGGIYNEGNTNNYNKYAYTITAKYGENILSEFSNYVNGSTKYTLSDLRWHWSPISIDSTGLVGPKNDPNYFKTLATMPAYDQANSSYTYNEKNGSFVFYGRIEPTSSSNTYILSHLREVQNGDTAAIEGKYVQEGPTITLKDHTLGSKPTITDDEVYDITGYKLEEIKQYEYDSDTKTYVGSIRYKLVTYDISFNLNYKYENGSTPAGSSQTVKYSYNLTVPDKPVREGYIFTGWYTEAQGSSTPIISNTTTAGSNFSTPAFFTEENILFAGWIPETFTVTFDVNGGTPVSETDTTAQTVEYNQKAANPGDLEKNGYVFKGWYAEGSSYSYDFESSVTQDFTLTARWEVDPTVPVEYTIKYVDLDGNELLASDSGSDTVGKTIKASAKEISGYFPDTWDGRLVLSGDAEQNVITFTYTSSSDIKYTVNHGYYVGDTFHTLYTDSSLPATYSRIHIQPNATMTAAGWIPKESPFYISVTNDNDLNVFNFSYMQQISADVESISVTYDGQAYEPVVTGLPTGIDFVTQYKVGNGEYSSTVPSVTNVSDGNVTVDVRITGPEYMYAFEKTITMEILPATLTATVEDETIIAGETPEYIITVSGFVNGETALTASNYDAPIASSGYTTDAGVFTISITGGSADNYVFDVTDEATLTVYDEMSVSIVGNSAVTAGANLALTLDVSGGDGTYSYVWTVDSSASGTSNSLTIDPVGSALNGKTVSVTVTDGAGNVKTASVNLIVYDELTVTINGNEAVTDGDKLDFTLDVSGGDGTYTYAWTVDGTPSGSAASLTINPIDSDLNGKTVSVTVTDGAGNVKTASVDLTVLPAGTFIVKYYQNSGISDTFNESVSYNTNEVVHLPSADDLSFVNAGATQIGWAKTNDAAEPAYLNGQTIEYDGNTVIELYAVWSTTATFEIKYHMNDGSDVFVSKFYENTASIDILTAEQAGFVRTDYAFENWSVATAGSEPLYAPGLIGEDLSSQTFPLNLYAQWVEGEYEVQFVSEDPVDGLPLIQRYNSGNSVNIIDGTELINVGSKFAGWKSDVNIELEPSAGLMNEFAGDGNENFFMPESDIVFTAKWETVSDKFTITYNGNGYSGAVPEDLTEYQYNEEAEVKSHSMEYSDYTFEGWVDADGSGNIYNAGDKFNMVENVTLYAKWTLDDVPNPADQDVTSNSGSSGTGQATVVDNTESGTMQGEENTESPSSGFTGIVDTVTEKMEDTSISKVSSNWWLLLILLLVVIIGYGCYRYKMNKN
ncbi:hypothetical protein MmiHf6_10620 [Methanimicrococcus hongohii]|uniref:MucBP domain-containing protein n=1 Tax=Methanimicrococcus hongohii TaxID=3028295 RepID=A0AA96VB80_9EURY|nr:InlB B-repeat-containing protein [Methanimicrococcus sp. Hf6]WNY23747.1 hypothetical protein MmiHf6_10620 [Methanimicrococcus sp. Hf6]